MDKIARSGKLKGVVIPPCSKSYAQRALAAALLAEGRSTLRNLEFCDDTLAAMRSIQALGARIEKVGEDTLVVDGGISPLGDKLYVGESGLSTRLFTPIASLCSEPITIIGKGSILHRPMTMMIEPLRELGVQVRDGGGYLPIEVKGPIKGGEVSCDGSVSSQFVTGLLLALPVVEGDSTLKVDRAVSTPYIDMTIDTAMQFGVEIHHKDYAEFFIEGGQKYQPISLSIEGDWSSAASMLVAGAIAGEVKVANISTLSKQADTAVCVALERAGASLVMDDNSITVLHRPLKGFEFDATQCPDLFPVLAALAASAKGWSTIIGTSRLEHKESNRAETIREEFEKLGIEVDITEENIMKIRGGKVHAATVDAHGDHRIAMALALAGLICEDGEIVIQGAECVAKSYPDFFEELDKLRA